MNVYDDFRLLRRLLLLWVSLVAIWGVLGISSYQCTSSWGTSLFVYPKSAINLTTANLFPKTEFLLFMLAHAMLFWAGLTGKITRHFYWLYFPTQGALVFAASLAMHQANVAINLYLALTLGSIIMLRQVRAVIGVASAYILLLILCMLLSATPLYSWKLSWTIVNLNSFWFNFWNNSDSMALILFVVGYLMLYAQQVRSHTQLTSTHSQLAMAHSQLKLSAERIEELSRVAERQRLARELHDTLAQGVAGIIMQIQVAHSHLALHSYERAQQIMQQTLHMSREILTSARRAIDDLRVTLPSAASLAAAIDEEIRCFTATTGVICTPVALDLLSVLPVASHEHVLRMVREALNNVAHHAHASHVLVACECVAATLTIQVQDDGDGFDPTMVEVHMGHYGLLGLRERARLIGGSFEVMSTPGQGTVLQLSLPYISQEHEDE